MDIKKILVPIDGSDASERAFSYAVAFAKKTAAELILLYVVDADVLMYPVYRVSLAETDTAWVKQKGEDFLALYAQDAPEDVMVNRMVTIGVPGSSIIRTAEAEGVDLIVMGNSGKGSVSSFVMGSVSHYTVHHAKCPVLIVK